MLHHDVQSAPWGSFMPCFLRELLSRNVRWIMEVGALLGLEPCTVGPVSLPQLHLQTLDLRL